MNVKRFTARNAREALTMVREQLGEDAVVLSTKPCAGGVEVLAMAPEGMRQIEEAAQQAPLVRAPQEREAAAREAQARDAAAEPAPPRLAPARPLPGMPAARGALRIEPRLEPGFGPEPEPAATPVDEDVQRLAMSTLSFQDYVRERMLKRRQNELQQAAPAAVAAAGAAAPLPRALPPRREPPVLRDELPVLAQAVSQAAPIAVPPVAAPAPAPAAEPAAARRERGERGERGDTHMLAELREMKGLIEERFGALAFMEKMQRNPRQVALSQKLLEAGFSPALIRKLVDSLPADVADEGAWAANVLERNLLTDEHEPPLEDQGGVLALIGATGVGKTTSTAKIAAAFATRHGAGSLGLITLDAYRVAAHEQLRTYGRILGVPVHTAHDRASLEDLLDLLSAKKMVLIDTAGMAQRDSRTREMLEMVSHRSIQKLLVLNAAAQGETIEDVAIAYRAATCRGVVLSKLDEAVKLGPALDALIRHKLKVVGVANGQRVPEDWHRLSAQALLHRALRVQAGASSWRLDASDVNLVFAAVHQGRGVPLRAPRG